MIIFTVDVYNYYDLKIQHLGTEVSNVTISNDIEGIIENFQMLPDVEEYYTLKEGEYNVSWVNGENLVNATYEITLNSDENGNFEINIHEYLFLRCIICIPMFLNLMLYLK